MTQEAGQPVHALGGESAECQIPAPGPDAEGGDLFVDDLGIEVRPHRLPCMVGMGALSDRLGRKPILLAATVLAFVSAVPLFWLMHQDQRLLVQLGQLGFVLSVGMFLGTQPTLRSRRSRRRSAAPPSRSAIT